MSHDQDSRGRGRTRLFESRRRPPQGRRGRRMVAMLEALEGRWVPSLTVQFADAMGVVGTGSVDVQSNSVTNDASGNVYVTGSLQGSADFDPSAGTFNLTSTGGRDIFLAKYSSTGALVWARDLPGAASTAVAQATSIAVDASGNVTIGGTFTGSVNFDPNGGNTTLSAPTRNDGFVAHFSADGSLLWAKAMTGALGDYNEVYTVTVDSAGNVYAGGSFQNTVTFGSQSFTAGGTNDSFVSKLDTTGQFVWTSVTTGSLASNTQAAGLAVDSSGNVLVTGFYAGSVDFDPGLNVNIPTSVGSRDVFVEKLDPSGGLAWVDGMGSTDIDQGAAVAVDSGGNVYVTGTFGGTIDFDPTGSGKGTLFTPGGFLDAFLVKFAPNGQTLWARDLASAGYNYAQGTGVGVDSAGQVYVSGYYQGTMTLDPSTQLTSQGSTDVFLAKYDTSGNVLDSQSYGGANFDAEFGLGVSSSGQLAIAGRYSGPATFGSFTLPAQPNKSIFVAQVSSGSVASPPPAPSAPVLDPSNDTGLSSSDGITNLTTLQFSVATVASPSNVVELLRDGTVVASRTGAGVLIDAGPIPIGVHTYTARQTDPQNGASPESTSVSVTIVTSTPATPTAPALATLDDSGTLGDGITNVRSPRLVGTVDPNTLVQLLDALGSVVTSTLANGSGAYTLTIPTSLSDGSYTFRVREEDLAGNLSQSSSPLLLTVLATTPATPSTPVLLAADDSGTLGDGITNVVLPHLTGTAPASATIQLLNAANTVIGSATATAGGTYSVQPTVALSNGTYVLHVQAVDAAGNLSAASGAFTVTVLATTPATPSTPVLLAADDSGTLGDGITNVVLPHLTGTAPASSTIQLLNVANTVIGSATATAGGTYSVQPTVALSNGTYVLHVQAIDAAGNLSAASGAFTVTVLATTPATPSTPVLLAADDSGTLGDGITNVKQPHLTGTTTAGLTVQLVNSAGTVIGSAASGASYSVAPTSPLSDGTYVLHVQAVDAAGNVSVVSGTVTLTIQSATPTTPAAPTLLAADDSGTLGDRITNVVQPRLTGTAPLVATNVQIVNGQGTVLGSAAVVGGSYTVPFSAPLSNGTYAVMVRVVDVAGNVSASSSSLSLTIQTTAPSTPAAPTLLAADDAGTLGDGITSVHQPRLIGSATAGTTVQLLDALGNVLGISTVPVGGAYTVQPATPLADGTYAVRVRLVDVAGNISGASPALNLTLRSPSAAPTSAPTLLAADDTGTLGDRITRINQPHLVGIVASGTTAQIVDGSGTVYGSGAVGVGGAYSITFTSPLADGTYTFMIRTLDSAGIPSLSSPGLSLTILTATPTAPGMPSLLAADDSGVAGDGITNVTRPRFSGVGPANTTIQLLDSSYTTIGTATAAANGAFQVAPTNALPDGTYTFYVRTLDVAGNGSLATGPFHVTILATPPAAPSTPALLAADDSGTVGDGTTNVTQPHLVGSATAGTTLSLIDGGGNVLGTTTVNVGGGYSVQPSQALADGTYLLHVQASDVAGNLSAASGTFTLVISTTVVPPPPAVPSAPALATADDSGVVGDGVTNVSQPHLVGTGTAGTTVQILDAQMNVLGSAVVAGNGTYSVGLNAPLADGTYTFEARALDGFGQYSDPSGDGLVTILTVAPAVPSAPTLLAVDDTGVVGDGITSNNRPRLVGFATAGTTAQLVDGSGNVLGSIVVGGDGSFQIQPTNSLSDGVWSLRVQAVDMAGNVSATSLAFSLTIQATPPSTPAAPALLTTDDTGIAGDGKTSVRLPHLTGTVAPGLTVDLLNATGNVIATGAANGSGVYSLQPPSNLGIGATSFRVRLHDAAGNVSNISPAFSLTIVDASPLDFNGNGTTDLAIYHAANALWIGTDPGVGVTLVNVFGSPAQSDIPVPGDYDGNGRTEMAYFRPSTAQWWVMGPNGPYQIINPKNPTGAFGATGLFDIPVPGDYDGVGYTEPAIFRPSTGQWYVLGPSGVHQIVNPKSPNGGFGMPNLLDIPVPGDYDGVGHTEPAVFRPSTGQWFVLGPNGGRQIVNAKSPTGAFGAMGLYDIPVPGDYDGVGHTQLAVYRPAVSQWYVLGPNGGRLLGVFGQANLADLPLATSIGALRKLGIVNGIRVASIPSAHVAAAPTASQTVATAKPTTDAVVVASPPVASKPKSSTSNLVLDRVIAELTQDGND